MDRFDNIGPVLRALRSERNWSQAELARRAGISGAMLSNYERGLKVPTLRTFGALLDALGIYLGPLDDRLDRANGRRVPEPSLPTTLDSFDLDRFLGCKPPPELVPAFGELVAGFQTISRHLARRMIAERLTPP